MLRGPCSAERWKASFVRPNTPGRTRPTVSAHEYTRGANTALQPTPFPVPSRQRADLPLRNPASLTLRPHGSLPTQPSSGAPWHPGRRPPREADAGPKFPETSRLPAPVLHPSPSWVPNLIPASSRAPPKATPGPTSSPSPPTQNPEGGKVHSLFFVNSSLITPAIPQSVCTVIVEFDAND